DIDGPEHGDQSEQIEPRREPAGEPVAQDRAPVIEPARRRIGRSDLRQSEREHARHGTTERPAEANRGAARARRALGERVDAARENADDREGDREIGELAHAPVEFLRIAHAVENLHVLLFVGLGIATGSDTRSVSHCQTPRFVARQLNLTSDSITPRPQGAETSRWSPLRAPSFPHGPSAGGFPSPLRSWRGFELATPG